MGLKVLIFLLKARDGRWIFAARASRPVSHLSSGLWEKVELGKQMSLLRLRFLLRSLNAGSRAASQFMVNILYL